MADLNAGRPGRGYLAASLLATFAVALLLAACGDDDGQFQVDDGVEPVGDIRAGSVAQLADCEDWNAGSEEEKKATVVDLREQLSGGGTLEGTPSLTDQEAFELFERACSNEFTSAFQLYKIYFRGAAFNNFDPEQFSP